MSIDRDVFARTYAKRFVGVSDEYRRNHFYRIVEGAVKAGIDATTKPPEPARSMWACGISELLGGRR